jgi:hypothetical protein
LTEEVISGHASKAEKECDVLNRTVHFWRLIVGCTAVLLYRTGFVGVDSDWTNVHKHFQVYISPVFVAVRIWRVFLCFCV